MNGRTCLQPFSRLPHAPSITAVLQQPRCSAFIRRCSGAPRWSGHEEEDRPSPWCDRASGSGGFNLMRGRSDVARVSERTFEDEGRMDELPARPNLPGREPVALVMRALTAAPDSVGLGFTVLVARRAGRRERGRDCRERPGPWPTRRPARRPSDLGEIHLRAPRRPRPPGAAPASPGSAPPRRFQSTTRARRAMMAAPHICRGRRVQRARCGGSRDEVPYRGGQGPAPIRRASPPAPGTALLLACISPVWLDRRNDPPPPPLSLSSMSASARVYSFNDSRVQSAQRASLISKYGRV